MTSTMNYQVSYFEGPAMRLQVQNFTSHEQAVEFFKKIAKSNDTVIVIRGDEVIMQDAPDSTKLNKLKEMTKAI